MSKKHISRLAAIMVAKGMEQVVVSPGSRNAPVIILFGANKALRLISVADERSAGFYALGLALQSHKPVALLCTSGSAVLNYAPAIAEAYYQKIPLLIITADRPAELIDQGDSQTIRQPNVYANYIRKSFNLPVSIQTEKDELYFDRIVNEAIDRTQHPAAGPVQLNLPLDEPLYDIKLPDEEPIVRIIEFITGTTALDSSVLNRLATHWKSAASKLILAGQMSPNRQIRELLKKLAADPTVAVLTESTSNLNEPEFINCIDRTLAQIPPEKNEEFKPEILLTIGGAIVSKKIKAMLRTMQPIQHWHVNADPEEFHYDTYQSLNSTIALQPEVFLQQLVSKIHELGKSVTDAADHATYALKWKQADEVSARRHAEFMKSLEFSDMKVYEHIFNQLPESTCVHLANSTPVRYGQLFNHNPSLSFYSNRGVSGIDGCSSTAAGFAYNHQRPVVLITGDIGFFYDSNALWNSNLPGNFRIIVINNGGGNIFRIIDGPIGYPELEPYIETHHQLETAGIAANFNIPYYRVQNEEELKGRMQLFLAPQSSGRPALLEVITNNKISAQKLKDYFCYLRTKGQ